MDDIKLYSSKVCPFAHRCRLALDEKGLDYTLINIDLRNKPSWYRDINPLEAVPALVQEDFVITESLVINEFINDLQEDVALLPKSPRQKALVRRCIAAADSSFVPSFYRLLKAQNEKDQGKAGDRILDALCQIDEDLGLVPGPYLFGEGISLADIAIYPWFERWPVLEHYRGLQIPEALERLHQWIAAMQGRENVKKNMGETDFYIAEYTDYANGNK